MEMSAAQGGGKAVGLRLYLHVDALPGMDAGVRTLVDAAVQRISTKPGDFNVVRVEKGGTVALLDYPAFLERAFPTLSRSWRVDSATGRLSYRDYRDSLNPPVLHRKELLLPQGHPDIPRFAKLTADLEGLGLFEDSVRIGFRVQWEALLRERGYRVVGHDLVPIGNVEGDEVSAPFQEEPGVPVLRHLTALSRQSLSAPVSAMIRLGLLDEGGTFFDYGCGRGDDVAALRAAGFRAAGWDPYFAPGEAIERAEVVNIGFVINVIEDPAERREALVRAFELADMALCVSAMLATDGEIQGKPYADGVLTRRNTFQRYYSQAGLREYVEHTLRTPALALAPGVFLVFKDPAVEQAFQLRRSRTRLRIRFPALPHPPKPPKHPKLPRPPKEPRVRPVCAPKPPPPPKPEPWEKCPDAFLALCRTLQQLGREPFPDEVDQRQELEEAFGSWPRALRAACGRLDQTSFDAARAQRTEDVLVYLALQRFGRRKQYRQLDLGLQRDIKALLHDYVSATDDASRLLAQAAAPEKIADACASAAERGLGWLIEGRSLHLHSSLVPRLPALLRVYVGCAAVLYGDLALADLVKIHIASGKVTMMRCDDFDLPLPKVVERVKINLRTQDVRFFAYDETTGYVPATLYLKSRFMNEEMSGYAEQAEFDRCVAELVEVDEMSLGSDDNEFTAALRRAGLKIAGRSIVEDDAHPMLDDPCGAHLTYRDLIICGETARKTGLPNLPLSLDSYHALRDLAEKVLDPVIDWYGSIELTYGFCSPELARQIPGRIAPSLDQHAAHELNRSGKPICPRLGAAVDFLVQDEDMYEVARWVAANTPFDRLYIYGRDQPIHVSYGPERKRDAWEMTKGADGRRIPKRCIW